MLYVQIPNEKGSKMNRTCNFGPMTSAEQYEFASKISKDDWNYLCTKKDFIHYVDCKSIQECNGLATYLLERRQN